MAAKKKSEHSKEEFRELFDQLTPEDAAFVFNIMKGMAKKTLEAGPVAPELTMYTLRDLTSMLSVSYRTLQNWVRSGYLPTVKLGNKRVISETDLLQFIQENRIKQNG